MTEKLKVGVVGATGYMGAELLRLLLVHPQVEVATVMASERSAGTPIGTTIEGRITCEGATCPVPLTNP